MAAVAAGLLALAGAAGADDKAKADDQKAIQGTWKVQSAEAEGGAPPPEELEKIRFVIQGDVITIDRGEGQKRPAKYKLNAGKKPKQIDLVPEEGPEKGRTLVGIYEVTGDTLKLCLSR